jgi:hypothetical protein
MLDERLSLTRLPSRFVVKGAFAQLEAGTIVWLCPAG